MALRKLILLVGMLAGASSVHAIIYPADKSSGIPSEGAVLTWDAGKSATGFNIYLSKDKDAVANGADAKGEAYLGTTDKDTRELAAGKLDPEATYYWKFDKIQGSKLEKGDVMEFTTFDNTIFTRLNGGKPIITKDIPGVLGEGTKTNQSHNINGPSMIRVPDWIPPEERAHPDAVYYLYFAHHSGNHIRLAWAKDIEGPYTIYNPGYGVVGNEHVKSFLWGHTASPDVHIDNENKRIYMYVHGGCDHAWKYWQSTVVVISNYGLKFRLPAKAHEDGSVPHHLGKGAPIDAMLGNFYYKAFQYKGDHYAITNFGHTYMARNAEDPFNADLDFDGNPDFKIKGTYLWNTGKTLVEEDAKNKTWRHATVRVRGDTVDVWFSTRAETPEHIRHTKIDLSVGFENWEFTPPKSVLIPELPWEGTDLPLKKSKNGAGIGLRELRDPAFFRDIDGKEYMLYTGRGEEAIGLAIFNSTKNNTIASVQREKALASKPEISVHKGYWSVNIQNPTPFIAKVYDARGKVVQSFEKGGASVLEVNQEGLTRGVYYMSVKHEGHKVLSYKLPLVQ